ncbi:MAG TPA: DUF6318 family protein, partial [Jatrophihabitans sp.]|nr:DUF6318 family protein [Jatrophihabitans sp.]
PNLSPVSSAPSSSAVSGSAAMSVPAAAVAGYPADVPLTGHNVRPGERPPVYPAAARARTQAGANAFAEFFMRTLDWAYATTNPSYMKHYYGPSCGLCSGIATGIAKTAAEHHWYEGGRLTILNSASTAIGPVTAPADFCSAVVVTTTAQTVVDRTGRIFNGAAANGHLGWKLCSKRQGAGWSLTYFAATS